jgi:ParB-like chromosome segregation protein Spo0J
MTDAKLKITDETRKVADLKADPKNARRHSEAQIATIVQSIERFGYVNKIVIQPKGQIIGGHATLEALKRLAHTEIECRVVSGLSPAQYAALALALNKIPENSSWDADVLRDVIGELHGADEDLGGIGFSTKELEGLMAEDEPLEVRTIETGDVEDEFWISVRGPLAQQADALKELEAVMKKFAGVSVELGTINVGH